VSAFDTATAVYRTGPGRYTADVDETWHVFRGANGGAVAAVLLRALMAEVDDPGRPPRSISIHYPSVFAAGPTDVSVAIERSGRSLTTASARAAQQNKPVALALAAFSPPRPGVELHNVAMPDVPGPDQCPTYERMVDRPPVAENYTYRLAAGPPLYSGAPEADIALWMQLREPAPLDFPLLAALTDGFAPAIFATQTGPLMSPTIDLTIHFRASLPEDDAGPWLGLFRTRLATGGFMEEDAEIWSPDGVLLAHSRQLALAVPMPA